MTFNKLSDKVTHAVGSPYSIAIAVLLIIVWAPTILILKFEAWNFSINTITTIITFLMVFLIQASQNRDTKAIHAKLDALIDASPEASDIWKHIEEKSVTEIEQLRITEEKSGN